MKTKTKKTTSTKPKSTKRKPLLSKLSIKSKPKFSTITLLTLLLVIVFAGGYFVYDSFAAGSNKFVNGQLLLNKAWTQKGYTENCPKAPKNNNGTQITKYLNAGEAGSHAKCNAKGYSWCVAFISWVWQNTNLSLKDSKPVMKENNGAKLVTLLKSSKFKRYVNYNNVVCGTNYFSPGDILFRRPGQETGHVGMVKSYNAKTQTLVTIEGNADDQVKSKTYKGKQICNYTNGWTNYAHWLKQ